MLQLQTDAVEKLIPLKTRRFAHTKVAVTTVGGSTLWVKSWTSDSAPLNTLSPGESSKVCSVCHREFLDRRRLAIHKNVHTKEDSSAA